MEDLTTESVRPLFSEYSAVQYCFCYCVIRLTFPVGLSCSLR